MVALEPAALGANRDAAIHDILSAFGFTRGATISGVALGGAFAPGGGPAIETLDPTTGSQLARITTPSHSQYDEAVSAATSVFARWRLVPAPRRGEIVRQ